MYPLDFEEFCWAMGDELTVPFAREAFERMQPLGQAAHATILRRYREYLAVGGMPQAVNAYLAERDKFIQKFSNRLGTPYILYTKDVMRKNGIVHLPLYMAPFICDGS